MISQCLAKSIPGRAGFYKQIKQDHKQINEFHQQQQIKQDHRQVFINKLNNCAGPAAGTEVARLRKWHVWRILGHVTISLPFSLYIYIYMYTHIYIYIHGPWMKFLDSEFRNPRYASHGAPAGFAQM